MKNVTVVLGSPRRNGNSAIMANKAMEGIKASGGDCEVFYLNGMKIRPCQACGYCQRDKDNLCALYDDMGEIYRSIKNADAILIASPVYMFTFTAQIKLFMDRCYACSEDLAGKKIGILLTYGNTDEVTSGAANAINTFKDEYRYTNSEIVGIVCARANEKGEVLQNGPVIERAFQLGKDLAEWH